MRIIYDVKHRYEIRSKVEGKFLTFLTKLVLETETNIWFTIKDLLSLS